MLRVHPHGHRPQVRSQDHRKGYHHKIQSQGKGKYPLTQLASEIEIHKSVKSEFVAKYEKHFEDSANVYILLELCTNQVHPRLLRP